jgi:predicted membrane channel-forming protein YqfA (hemolysin III family)
MAGSKNKEKRKQMAHIPAALTILMHAFERYHSDHGSWLFFAIAGVCFLSLVIFHKRIANKFPWSDGAFFLIEGCLSLIVFYEFIHAGKKALPLVYLGLACFQFIMAWVMSRKGIKHHKENGSH